MSYLPENLHAAHISTVFSTSGSRTTSLSLKSILQWRDCLTFNAIHCHVENYIFHSNSALFSLFLTFFYLLIQCLHSRRYFMLFLFAFRFLPNFPPFVIMWCLKSIVFDRYNSKTFRRTSFIENPMQRVSFIEMHHRSSKNIGQAMLNKRNLDKLNLI